jgi:hypothetical protein
MSVKTATRVIDEDHFIDINDDGEIDFWMVMLGLSAKTLVKAVGIVGPDAREVRKWMKQNNPKNKPPFTHRVSSFLAKIFKRKPSHSVSQL